MDFHLPVTMVNAFHPNDSPGMDRTHEFGQMLRTLREARDLSQEDLAEVIDRAVSSVSNLETGKSLPKLETLIRLSEKLDVPLRELVNVFDPTEPGDPERITLETRLLDTTRRLSVRDLKIVTEIANAFPQDR